MNDLDYDEIRPIFSLTASERGDVLRMVLDARSRFDDALKDRLARALKRGGVRVRNFPKNPLRAPTRQPAQAGICGRAAKARRSSIPLPARLPSVSGVLPAAGGLIATHLIFICSRAQRVISCCGR